MEVLQNTQPKHQIKHRYLDTNNLFSHSLSLFIGKNEITYTIAHDLDKVIVFLKSYTLKDTSNFFAYKLLVKDFLEQEELLKNNFKEIKISISATPSTLVPNEYFDAEHIEPYYTFNHFFEGKGSSQLLHDTIEQGEHHLHNIYAVDHYLLETIRTHFKDFSLHHAQTFFLNTLLQSSEAYTTPKLYVHVQSKQLDLIAINNQQLIFQNSYAYETPEDFLYYLLNTVQQIDFNVYDTDFVLLGNIDEDNDCYQRSKKYLSNLQFGSRPDSHYYCSELNDLPPHQYFNVYSIV